MDLWTNELVDKWTNGPKVKRLELIRNLDDPEARLFLGVCVKKITDKEMSEQPLLKNSNRHHIAPFVQNLGYERLLPFPGISAAAAARACTHRREHFFPPKMFFTFFRVFFSKCTCCWLLLPLFRSFSRFKSLRRSPSKTLSREFTVEVKKYLLCKNNMAKISFFHLYIIFNCKNF